MNWLRLLDLKIGTWLAHKLGMGLGGAALKGETTLIARHIRNGKEIDRRVIKNRVVTTAFVNYVVDQLQAETSSFGDFKYHDSGTGTTAENITDTAMETATGESRSTGTQTEGSANEYKSVATDTYAGSFAITEHGLFNASSSGTLMDRTVFSALNVVSGDAIQYTFTISFASGG